MDDSDKIDINDVDAVVIGNGMDSEDDELFPSLNTRSSSTIFVKAVSGLSDAQRNAVREMGLGSLLELTITATPLKMGFWIVNNFNHMDRKLHLYDGEKVHIKEEDVHAAFGFPRGHIDIRNKQKRATSELLDDWVRLFNVRIQSNITVSKVLDKIHECVDGGDWFKRHFLVLMVTCLFESSSNGIANFRIVHMLDDLTKVCKMNWCSYMIRCLVDTKRTWDASGKQKKDTGPLLFMTLFYVDKVVLSMRSIDRSFPIFLLWTNESLRAREQDEITVGAFGRGFVDADTHVVVDYHKSDRDGATTNDNKGRITMESNVQAYVQEFASKTRLLATIGDEILQLVNKAPQKLLGVYIDSPKANPDNHDPRRQDHTVPASDIAKDNEKGATYQVVDDAFWNDPETLAAIDAILKAVERCDHFKRMQFDVPSFSLGIFSDDDDEYDTCQHTSSVAGHDGKHQNAEKSPGIDVQRDHTAIGEEIGLHNKDPVTAETAGEISRGDDVNVSPRPKRRIKPTSVTKSPYMKREIDVTKKLDGDEKMCVNWILKNGVLDEYGFVYIVIIVFNRKTEEVLNYKKFAQTLDSEIARMSIYQLKQIHVFQGERNLVKKSKLIGLVVPEVFDTAWTEGVDRADIGVITMRHMETFKGGIAKTWNPQLKKADKGQIKLIRKRCICVIAFALNNKLNELNLVEAQRFHLSCECLVSFDELDHNDVGVDAWGFVNAFAFWTSV
ncbi:E3 ubiquitin-protein ligase [Striga asiatica]|uniref:E3 ubiquitin-protein ligase n=1 Tax=Striga asiatica TaxID=4170 RepID=A0A5A7PJG2_STRAF|nr:E3 ubiquitin-protein ligase [Striga asiatica]